MENWGLVTYRDSALLYNNNSNSGYNYQDQIRAGTDICHELGHQWVSDSLIF